MRFLIVIFCLFTVSVRQLSAAPQMVCDEETGICKLVDADDVPAGEEITGETTEYPVLVRKLVGYTGVPEFLAFLKGEDAPAAGKAFWVMILIALAGGLALNLTPCVLPMLPVNLAIIGASGGAQGFRRGLLYGIGMAAVYGILGVLAAFAGVGFGSLNSSPVFNFVIALIYLLLSLGMAGVFALDPASKFHISPGKLKVSMDLTALLMGGVSALLAGACVAPVVISVLLFAAGTGWYGCFVPFALGIGMALPWPFAGAGLAVLPKPGRFMVVIKYLFAVIIFGAAVYYTVLGIKLLPDDGVPAAVDGFEAFEAAQIESEETGKPILVKFTASWCKNCHAMEKTTLKDPETAKFIKDNFIMVTFPAEDPGEPETAALLKHYGIPGFPAFIIVK